MLSIVIQSGHRTAWNRCARMKPGLRRNRVSGGGFVLNEALAGRIHLVGMPGSSRAKCLLGVGGKPP